MDDIEQIKEDLASIKKSLAKISLYIYDDNDTKRLGIISTLDKHEIEIEELKVQVKEIKENKDNRNKIWVAVIGSLAALFGAAAAWIGSKIF